MDEQQTRTCVQAHADAVVRGDFDHVTEDFIVEMRPQVPAIGQSLPQPVTSAEVQSLTVGDEESVAEISYTGDSGSVTIRSHWRDVDGRPQIVAGQPI
ncbi:MAG: hypothetical protein WBQ18_10385 [Solirubrobacteraceae bacterium]|jgi:hypothetical protein